MTTPFEATLSRVALERLEKVRRLRAAGQNPFPNDFKPDAGSGFIKETYDQFSAEELEARKDDPACVHRVAGRVMAVNSFGKAAFVRVQDRDGRLQWYVRKDVVGDTAYEAFKGWDVGDLVAASGRPFRTRTNELSLLASEVRLLCKAVRPLPEKFHGLKDKEQRFRQRYVDLFMNPEVTGTFLKRNRIIKGVRRYLDQRGYIEVETPMMHPIPGGASARPFKTHHNALDLQLYLRIAPELYLKRLIVGGLERVYEINRNFRNEGIDRNHNPEFTMIELYQAYATYDDMMNLTEELISGLVQEVTGGTTIQWQGRTLDFTRPWKRVTMEDALVEYGSFPREKLNDNEALKAVILASEEADKYRADLPTMEWGHLLATAFEVTCEHQLVNPTFITRFPVAISPLARRNEADPRYVDRFELYVATMEVANAFSELNDPEDQAERFEAQLAAGAEEFQDTHCIDHDFVRALSYGMPPTAGEGIGIDRLVMLLTDSDSIKEVILFPLLRPEEGRAAAEEDQPALEPATE